jgi:hypothetical protein
MEPVQYGQRNIVFAMPSSSEVLHRGKQGKEHGAGFGT